MCAGATKRYVNTDIGWSIRNIPDCVGPSDSEVTLDVVFELY